MSDELSNSASPKCKDRVELIEKGDKTACIDSKTRKGIAMCYGFALLKSGKKKDLSEAMKESWKKIREVCNDKIDNGDTNK